MPVSKHRRKGKRRPRPAQSKPLLWEDIEGDLRGPSGGLVDSFGMPCPRSGCEGMLVVDVDAGTGRCGTCGYWE